MRALEHDQAQESLEHKGFENSTLGGQLVEWVLEFGGHVHPGLVVVENAPCGGGRGIVSTGEITAEDAANMPLILVPDELYLTAQVHQRCPATCCATAQFTNMSVLYPGSLSWFGLMIWT